MCSPLYDDKGNLKYFIGAQVDVTGLVQDGRGIESFRQLLQRDQHPPTETMSEYSAQHKNSWLTRKAKEALDNLQELSIMFSQEESEIVNQNSRGTGDSDVGSIRSSVPTSTRSRGPTKRIIGEEQTHDGGFNFSQFTFGNGTSSTTSTLPGVYKYVSDEEPLRLHFLVLMDVHNSTF